MPIAIATAVATSGGGTDFARRFFSIGQRTMIRMLTRPISAMAGFRCAKPLGIDSIRWIIPTLGAVAPRARKICLTMMITPIPASIPCTTDSGKKSVSRPALSRPRTIWIAPQATPTARA